MSCKMYYISGKPAFFLRNDDQEFQPPTWTPSQSFEQHICQSRLSAYVAFYFPLCSSQDCCVIANSTKQLVIVWQVRQLVSYDCCMGYELIELILCAKLCALSLSFFFFFNPLSHCFLFYLEVTNCFQVFLFSGCAKPLNQILWRSRGRPLLWLLKRLIESK